MSQQSSKVRTKFLKDVLTDQRSERSYASLSGVREVVKSGGQICIADKPAGSRAGEVRKSDRTAASASCIEKRVKAKA